MALGTHRYDAVLDAEHRPMGLGVVEESPDHVTIRCSVAPDYFEHLTLLSSLGITDVGSEAGGQWLFAGPSSRVGGAVPPRL